MWKNLDREKGNGSVYLSLFPKKEKKFQNVNDDGWEKVFHTPKEVNFS